VKKVSKIAILNGKIEFFIKIDSNWPKSDQKSSKIDTYLEYKNEVKFDYQKGDSGSAGSLGQKCVMNQAPNLDTKSDQKATQQ